MKKYFYVKNDLSIDGLKIQKKSLCFAEDKKSQKISIYLINYGRNIEIKKDLLNEIDVTQTGDQHSNKICDRCFRYLPTNFFANNRIKKNAITKDLHAKIVEKLKMELVFQIPIKKNGTGKNLKITNYLNVPFVIKQQLPA